MKQNSKKTLFRKFFDWNDYHKDGINRVLCIFWIIICVVTCLLTHFTCGHEVHTYNESDYEYLEAVVNTIWDENTQTLKHMNIPNNVYIEEGDFSPSSVSFKCVLDAGHIVTKDPFVEVHISDNSDLKITHYTESEYISNSRGCFAVWYFLWCLVYVYAAVAVWWLVKISIYILCIVSDLFVKFVSWIEPHRI